MQRGVPRILRIDPRHPDGKTLGEAVSALRGGELVVVPTETVYGLAADPRVPGAVERIYAAKGRSDDKPITLLAADLGQIRERGVGLSPAAERLAARYWPGPLTMVLRAGDGFTGFRVPGYAVALAVLRAVGGALAVTSANRSGEPAALTADAAAEALGASVSVILDAGPSPGGVPSTVVRVDGERVEVLREGAIGAKEIWEMVNG